MNLDDVVLEVVRNFVKNGELFTALDVSNTVKKTLPTSRHREVRDLVRNLFSAEIESAGYARTPITVTLANGATTDALLYHALADSWDLDAKYGIQKRAQETLGFVKHGAQAVAVSVPAAPVATPAPAVPAPVPIPTSTIDLWNQMFQSQPSLFTNK